MYTLILIIHVLVCLVLVAVILLQAGRGGGIADVFGGGTQSILGTRASTFLTKATTICAAIFMLTSLSLAVLSVKRGRSLMERRAIPAAKAPPAATPSTPPEAPVVPAQSASKDAP